MNRIKRKNLLRLSKEQLAELLEEFLDELSPGQRRTWIQRNLPESMKEKKVSRIDERELLEEIKFFCDQSYDGAYVYWVPEHSWEEGVYDYSNYEEWTEICSDLLNCTAEMAAAKKFDAALKGFRSLFKLHMDARGTYDILGNQGPPEDEMTVDFGELIYLYTKSLLDTQNKLNDTIKEILPIAQEYRYWGGFKGLAQALDTNGRERLKKRLWEIIDSLPQEDKRWMSTDSTEGLIAIAEEENNSDEVLSLKEKFAESSALYLRDVIDFYRKKKDWASVVMWAKLGIKRYGQHKDYVDYLIKAYDILGDSQSALQVHLEYFLEDPTVEEYKKLQKRASAVGNRNVTLEKIIVATKTAKDTWGKKRDLRIRVQLAEGRDRETLEKLDVNVRLDFEDVKFIAKYAMARATSDLDFSEFSKLKELNLRLKREKSELYNWLRLSLKKVGHLTQENYIQLAYRMYFQLIEFHLNSGKSSRARPAAHYCAIIYQLSKLSKNSTLWSDLLNYLRNKHGQKRIIWERLKDEEVL